MKQSYMLHVCYISVKLEWGRKTSFRNYKSEAKTRKSLIWDHRNQGFSQPVFDSFFRTHPSSSSFLAGLGITLAAFLLC